MRQAFKVIFVFLGFFSFTQAIAKTLNGDLNLDHANLGHVTVNGSAELNNSNFKSLNINGQLKFKQLNIVDALFVNGAAEGHGLTAKKLTIDGGLQVDGLNVDHAHVNGSFLGNDSVIRHNITVDGELDGRHIQVGGKTIVHGGLNVHDSDFHAIEMHADYCMLQNTKVKHLVFKKIKNGQTQRLILSGHTVIEGNVDFETDSGEIVLDKEAVIKGKIIGGRIILHEGAAS